MSSPNLDCNSSSIRGMTERLGHQSRLSGFPCRVRYGRGGRSIPPSEGDCPLSAEAPNYFGDSATTSLPYLVGRSRRALDLQAGLEGALGVSPVSKGNDLIGHLSDVAIGEYGFVCLADCEPRVISIRSKSPLASDICTALNRVVSSWL